MSNIPVLPPPNWHSDPSDPTRERWWDGQSWTEHSRAVTPAIPVYAGAQQLAAPAEEPYVPMGGAYGSAYAGPYDAQQWQSADASPNTVPIWLIAAGPAVAFLTNLTLGMLGPDLGQALTLPVSLGLMLFYAGMAIWDHIELKGRGLAAASPAWVLLSILGYLIARRIVLKRSGVIHNAPGNVFAGLILLGIFAAFAFGFIIAALFSMR